MISFDLPPKKPIIEFPRPAIIMPHKHIMTPAETHNIKTNPPIGQLAPSLGMFGTVAGHGARSAGTESPFTITDIVYTDTNKAYSWTEVCNTGDPDPNRIIWCLVWGRHTNGGQDPGVSGIQIGGQNMSQQKGYYYSGENRISLYARAVPTGTSSTFFVDWDTFDETTSSAMVIFTSTRLAGLTQTDDQGAAGGSGTATLPTLTVPSGGVGLMIGVCNPVDGISTTADNVLLNETYFDTDYGIGISIAWSENTSADFSINYDTIYGDDQSAVIGVSYTYA